jgi:hypothetical protein
MIATPSRLVMIVVSGVWCDTRAAATITYRRDREAEFGAGSMQARIESSTIGRALISLGVSCTVVAVLVINMPDSQLKSHLMGFVAPYARVTGLDQDWGVFAPPRTISLYVEGHIDLADGTTTTVDIPSRPGIEAYADYRWHKFGERLRLDRNKRLWAPYARLLADRARAEGRSPVRVSLVRRWSQTLPPGPGPERGPWQEYTFFVMQVR